MCEPRLNLSQWISGRPRQSLRQRLFLSAHRRRYRLDYQSPSARIYLYAWKSTWPTFKLSAAYRNQLLGFADPSQIVRVTKHILLTFCRIDYKRCSGNSYFFLWPCLIFVLGTNWTERKKECVITREITIKRENERRRNFFWTIFNNSVHLNKRIRLTM